jgi:hypothetical protein
MWSSFLCILFPSHEKHGNEKELPETNSKYVQRKIKAASKMKK